jgi:hypothetical protein
MTGKRGQTVITTFGPPFSFPRCCQDEGIAVSFRVSSRRVLLVPSLSRKRPKTARFWSFSQGLVIVRRVVAGYVIDQPLDQARAPRPGPCPSGGPGANERKEITTTSRSFAYTSRMYAGHLDLTQPLVWTVDDVLSPADCETYTERRQRPRFALRHHPAQGRQARIRARGARRGGHPRTSRSPWT